MCGSVYVSVFATYSYQPTTNKGKREKKEKPVSDLTL